MSQGTQQELWIQDETTGASLVREREIIRIPNDLLQKIISKQILDRIDYLEKQVEILKQNKEINVPNDEAKKIISKTIKEFKSKGIKKIDIIDLYSKTHLPISQINKVMEELENEGIVSG